MLTFSNMFNFSFIFIGMQFVEDEKTVMFFANLLKTNK